MSSRMSVAEFFKRAGASQKVSEVPHPTVKKEAKREIVDITSPKSSKRVKVEEQEDDSKAVPVPVATKLSKKIKVKEDTPVKSPPPTPKAEDGKQATTALSGCTVVFSGEMSVDRDSATSLAQKAGAKVTSGVSGKTTYLVLGSVLEDGRPVTEGSKYKKMQQLISEKKPGPKPMTEEEFLSIVKGDEMARPTAEKMVVDSVGGQGGLLDSQSALSNGLWVDKYEPRKLSDFIGNKSNVDKYVNWLTNWKKNGTPKGIFAHAGFKQHGSSLDAKAVLLSGPPGVGKSLLARLGAKAAGFDLIEFNASDYRNKADVERIGDAVANSMMIGGVKGDLERFHILIMDECDGMSSGDRGGNNALIQVIKKTKIPIVCICNDRMDPKVRSLANHCLDLKFVKPAKVEVVNRCVRILVNEKCVKEGMEDNSLKNSKKSSVLSLAQATELASQIVDHAECDIRQSVNQLQLASFDFATTIKSFERKDKSTMLTAFDAARAIFAPPPEAASLNDRLECFFVDYDLVPLLVQQNYLKCFLPGEVKKAAKSASLICYGDLVSRAIRAEQNWAMLPTFGMLGSVFVPPIAAAPNEPQTNSFPIYPEFPVWLGKYSHGRKIARIAQELTCVVSTTSSITSRNILLSNYAHVLFAALVKELIAAGKAGDDSGLLILSALGVHKNDLMELLSELLLPWQPNTYEDDVDTKMKTAITRLCNNHHMLLKSGGAHFRHIGKAAGGGDLTSSVTAFKKEVEPDEVDESLSDQEDEEKKPKKDADSLVKAAKVTKSISKRSSKK